MKKLLPIIVVIIIIGMTYILRDISEKGAPKIIQDESPTCLSIGGQWSEEFRECTGIDAATCQNIGGAFNECASACRHTKQEMCTLQCIQVCEIK